MQPTTPSEPCGPRLGASAATGLAPAWTNCHPARLFPAWVIVSIVIALVVWCLVDIRRRSNIDPGNIYLHKTDITVYTGAAAAFFDGREPYTVTNSRGWSYIYPPLFALLLAPLNFFGPQGQAMVWFALSALFAWGTYVEIVRIAQLICREHRYKWSMPPWVAWAAFVAVALPGLNCLQRGQIGVLKLYLLMAGLRLILENRSAMRTLCGGLVLALPIAFKITPIVPVGFLLVQQTMLAWLATDRRPQFTRVAAAWSGVGMGLVLYFLLIPAALIGWHANNHHLQTWWNLVGRKANDTGYDQFAGNSQSARNQSLLNAVRLLGFWVDSPSGTLGDVSDDMFAPRTGPVRPEPSWVAWGVLGLRLGVATLVAWLALSMRRGAGLTEQVTGFGIATAATLIIAPIARVHYFVLLAPMAVFLPMYFIERAWFRTAKWLAIIPAGLIVAHYLAMGVVGRLGLLGIGITAWLVAAAALLVRLRRVDIAELSATLPERSPSNVTRQAA